MRGGTSGAELNWPTLIQTVREAGRWQGLPGLGPENVSFLFKIMHQILPTQRLVQCQDAERIGRISLMLW